MSKECSGPSGELDSKRLHEIPLVSQKGHSRSPWKLPETSLDYISLYVFSQNLLNGSYEALLIDLKIAVTSCQDKPNLFGCKLGG